MPDALLLITPWAETSTSSPSMSQYGRSQPLTRATVRWAQNQYAPDDWGNPRIDLANRPDLAGMPPTVLVLADLDPVAVRRRDAGEPACSRPATASPCSAMPV